MREERRFDALAGVDHADGGKRAVAAQPHGDASPGRRELDGVVDQVPQDLLGANAVAQGRHQFLFPAFVIQCQAFLAGGLARSRCNRCDHFSQVNRRQPQRQLARAGTRQVQQVIDDLGLADHGAANGFARPRHFRQRAHLGMAQQQFGVDLDQVQRVLEFMRHHGQKLVLEFVGLLFHGQQLVAAHLLRAAFGHVPGNLGKAAGLAFQPGDHAAAKKGAAILAQVPALVQAAAFLARAPQLFLRRPGGTVFGGENGEKRLANDFLRRIAKIALGTDVPAGDDALLIDGQNGVILGGFSGNSKPLLASAQPFLGLAQFGDIDKRQHDAINVVIHRAVGTNAGQVTRAVAAADWPLDRVQRLEHSGSIVSQRPVVELVGDVHQGAVDVGLDQVEDAGSQGRKALDVQVAVNKNGGNV